MDPLERFPLIAFVAFIKIPFEAAFSTPEPENHPQLRDSLLSRREVSARQDAMTYLVRVRGWLVDGES